MKKLIFCLAFILFIPVVKAGSYSASASSTSVNIGDSVTIYVSANQAAGRFSVSSSNSGVMAFSDNSSSVWIENGSSNFKFVAKSAGTATITVTPSDCATFDDEKEITDKKYITITVKAPSTNNGGGNTNKTNYNNNTKKKETKSSNNYLKSFGIEGYKISPDFDKNKTDYTLTVPNGTDKVKILAYQESDKAKISGHDGEVEVKEGENKLSTTIIAEDGSKRTYNITIIVESKPIVVKVDNQEYTLIKTKEELPNLDIDHEDTTLNFEGVDVPAYRIDKIGYILVGLKDSNNNKKLYEYVSYKDNEKPEEYNLFNYLKIRDMNLVILYFPKNKIPSGYKEYKEKINDIEYNVYKLDKDSNYSLFYAINVETGKEQIYKYESSEKTVQLYEKANEKKSVDNTEKYKKLILIMGGVIIILVLLTTIGFTKKPKDKTSRKEDKYSEDDEELSKKDIKKIEKSTKKETKKNKKKQNKGEPEF